MAACLWEYLSLNMCMKQPWDIEKAAFKSYKSNTEAAICSAIRASFFFLRAVWYFKFAKLQSLHIVMTLKMMLGGILNNKQHHWEKSWLKEKKSN